MNCPFSKEDIIITQIIIKILQVWMLYDSLFSLFFFLHLFVLFVCFGIWCFFPICKNEIRDSKPLLNVVFEMIDGVNLPLR